MTTIETQLKTSKRQLVIHDSIAFLILLAVTSVLFAVTLFLFRSFSAHRAEIARQAGEAGRLALSEGRPRDAIADLRTALSYAPNERSYELLLAQALGEDGRLEEAINYFLNLREAQPGDGFINLQLARLQRQRNDLQKNDHQRSGMQAAINYYRASIFGSWNGDGVIRRRDVRLELANYLIDQRQFGLAQTELLIAASNAPSDPKLSVSLGDTLLRVNDEADAMKQYQKALIEDPHDAIAYEKAGRIAYKSGDYTHARDWLEKALRESAGAASNATAPEGDTATLLKNAERLLLLEPDLAPDRSDRVSRLLDDRAIAKKRFDTCLKQVTAPETSLETLTARWTASASNSTRAALMRDDSNDDLVRSLIDDTETTTARICGAPEGDDALLLLLAQHSRNQ
jgi:tetratricopeptide (TPR) repeat protein